MMRDDIRASMMVDPPLRRSSRLSVVRPPPPPLTHALEEKSCWRVANQKVHNDKILDIVNTANVKILQTLPGIGPKTAISIHSYRYFPINQIRQ